MRPVWTTVGVVGSLLGLGLGFVGRDVAPVTLESGDVLAVGWLALLAALLVVRRRVKSRSPAHVAPADVERGTRAPIPGDQFDRVLFDPDGEYPMLPAGTNREYVQSVIRTLVRATLEVELDYGHERARRAVERGTWTDDPVAAWFLGDSDEDDPPATIPRRVRLRGRLDPEFIDEYAVGRTIDAIERIRGESS